MHRLHKNLFRTARPLLAAAGLIGGLVSVSVVAARPLPPQIDIAADTITVSEILPGPAAEISTLSNLSVEVATISGAVMATATLSSAATEVATLSGSVMEVNTVSGDALQ